MKPKKVSIIAWSGVVATGAGLIYILTNRPAISLCSKEERRNYAIASVSLGVAAFVIGIEIGKK